jgi:hypothetical protein
MKAVKENRKVVDERGGSNKMSWRNEQRKSVCLLVGSRGEEWREKG